MQRNPNEPRQPLSLGRLIGGLFLPLAVLVMGIGALLYHLETPLPDPWNPTTPLDPIARLTPITHWKLMRAVADPVQCRVALTKSGAIFTTRPDQNTSEQCHITTPTRISTTTSARLTALETRCELALRLTMWERHGIQPAARKNLKTSVTRIHHFGS